MYIAHLSICTSLNYHKNLFLLFQSQMPEKKCYFRYDKLVVDTDVYIYNEVI